jgi:hypothetical protein
VHHARKRFRSAEIFEGDQRAWGVIIDAGEHLALAPVGEQHPADDVHLPQLHGPAAFPSLEPAVAHPSGARIDHARTLRQKTTSPV